LVYVQIYEAKGIDGEPISVSRSKFAANRHYIAY
jgi:hypothetical protein